jgi:hypothetical protein
MGQARKAGFLDSVWARLAAILCAAAAAAALVYIHRADIWPDAVPAAADDPFSLCFVERAAGIDKLAAEGTISAPQATQFKARAAAMCRDAAGGNNRPPPPGQ